MTDGVASRSFFCLKTAKKLPKIERNCPNTIRQLLPNPPKNKSSKSGTRDCPETTLTLYKTLNGGVDIKTVFYKIRGDKISGRLFVNSIDCHYFCYGGKIYSGNNKTRWHEIL